MIVINVKTMIVFASVMLPIIGLLLTLSGIRIKKPVWIIVGLLSSFGIGWSQTDRYYERQAQKQAQHEKEIAERDKVLATLDPQWQEIVSLLKIDFLDNYQKYTRLRALDENLPDIPPSQFKAICSLARDCLRGTWTEGSYYESFQSIIVKHLTLKETH